MEATLKKNSSIEKYTNEVKTAIEGINSRIDQSGKKGLVILKAGYLKMQLEEIKGGKWKGMKKACRNFRQH